MTDVVERDLRPWDPATGRRTALVAAGLMLGARRARAAGAGQGSSPGSPPRWSPSGLVTGAIVLSRAQHEPEAAVAVAWMGARVRRDGRLPAGPRRPGLRRRPSRRPAAAPCSPGWSRWSGSASGAPCVIPPVVVGAVFLATGLVIQARDLRPRRRPHHRAGARRPRRQHVFPWLALGATGTSVDQLYSHRRHHRRPRRRRPAPGRDRRPAGPRDPGRGVRHRGPPAGAGHAAGGLARARRHRAWRSSARSRSCCAPGSTAPAPRCWSASSPASPGCWLDRGRGAGAAPRLAPGHGGLPGRRRRAADGGHAAAGHDRRCAAAVSATSPRRVCLLALLPLLVVATGVFSLVRG